jgi:hypothetical protein
MLRIYYRHLLLELCDCRDRTTYPEPPVDEAPADPARLGT